MTGVIATIPRIQFSNALGIPLAGGKLYTYLAGTTTQEPTYQDEDLTTANQNPITLDSTGSCVLWLDPDKSYKFLLKSALGITQPGWPVDNISGAANLIAIQPTLNLYAKLAALAAAAGSALMGFIQSGAGAIARTVQAELRDVVRVSQFGAAPNTGTDQGPAILAAHTYAQSINAVLEFPGGVYTIGAGTSFTIDPQKTRWRARGPVGLRWSAAPTAGFAVNIVAGETSPYETVRTMVDAALSGIDILGSTSAGALYSATGLRIGDGTHQTNALSIEHSTISGWTNVVDFKNNVWWITLHKCRLMWGTITTPASSGNWGENNTLYDCQLLDGVTMTLNYGEWRFFGGSVDNTKIVLNNNATMSGVGLHFENPGTTTLTQPFIDIQGAEARAHLVSPEIVINNAGSGSPITTAPFNVISTNTGSGLVLDGPQYTQGGFAQWYSFVSGGGKVVVRNPQILAFSNFNFQVAAENARGQLRNYGFETGDMSGWTVTANSSFGTSGSATVGTTRVRPGSTGTKSCQLSVTHTSSVFGDSEIAQTFAVQSGELVQYSMAISRQYTSAPGQYAMVLTWLDAAGATISTVSTGYVAAGVGTDDGTTFNRFCYNAIAPGGTVRATLKISFQSPNTIGTANLYVDDVFVNVIA